MAGAYLIGILIFIVSMIVSARLKSKFKKYSQIPLQAGYSGAEIAKKMLNDHGIYDVSVISVSGQLTDHYNPIDKTVNLSQEVYNGRNAAAAAIASHECGHAVQHSVAYTWLNLRSRLVPIVNVSSNFMQWILIIGIIILGSSGDPTVLAIGVGLFGLTTLFSFITLPVEFDASQRALAWIKNKNIVNPSEYDMSKDALKWAALTYVVAAIGSLATLIYYISMLLGSRR